MQKSDHFYQKERSAAAAAKSLHSCPTLCDPIDGSPPGSTIPGILQARKLEWVAMSFSNAWKWKVKVKSLSRAWLLATPWTAAHQAPPSMGFSRQEYWSGVPLPSPEHIQKIYSDDEKKFFWCSLAGCPWQTHQFSNFNGHQNHQADLLSHRLLCPTPRISDSVDLG